jgi:hypothetical protein
MITELLRDRHPVFSILGRSEARSFSTPAASGEWLSGAFHNGGGARTIPSERGNATHPCFLWPPPPTFLMTDTSPSHSIARILSRQREWSLRTSGPGHRTQSILRQIEYACAEIDQDGHDLRKCVRLLLHALDLCWRSGDDIDQIELALHAEMTANESRKWASLDWIGEDAKINHVRATDA